MSTLGDKHDLVSSSPPDSTAESGSIDMGVFGGLSRGMDVFSVATAEIIGTSSRHLSADAVDHDVPKSGENKTQSATEHGGSGQWALGNLDFVFEEFKEATSAGARGDFLHPDAFADGCVAASKTADAELNRLSSSLKSRAVSQESKVASSSTQVRFTGDRQTKMQILSDFVNEMDELSFDGPVDSRLTAQGLQEYLRTLDMTSRSMLRTVFSSLF